MTTFVLVHGAWHGSWAWERVTPHLEQAGAHVVTPDLTSDGDAVLQTHVGQVVAAIDSAPPGDDLVLVGHSYAGLVVRQAADLGAERVDRVVLVDGWAGGDGAAVVTLAPDWFGSAVRSAARDGSDPRLIPAPDPELFGVTDPADVRWLRQRLRPHPLATFTQPTRLRGPVDRIPGTGICCRPENFPFAQLAKAVGYRTITVDGPHDIMIARPGALAVLLLTLAPSSEVQEPEVPGLAW